MYPSIIANLVFPSFCRCCNKWLQNPEDKFFCSACWNKFTAIENWCDCCGRPLFTKAAAPLCSRCREKTPPYRRARAIGMYDGTLREAIHILKYEGKIGMGKKLAKMMIADFPRFWDKWEYDCIIPIPLHPRRLREREFNQSYILSYHLGRHFGAPILHDNLERIKFNQHQVGLDKELRLTNVKNCFALKRPNDIFNKKILLVDDVHTTGATTVECTKALKGAGAEFVDIYTLART